MNNVFLMGRLTRNIDLKQTATTTVARVGIAVDRKFSKEKAVDFFNLVAFGKTAEFMSKYFGVGSKILVEGRLQTSRYKDKDGNDRTSTDVIVEQVEFADSKKKAADSGGDKDFGGTPIDDSDTPF